MCETEETPSSVSDPNDFESEDVEIDDQLELRAAFSETLTHHGYPDTLVLSRDRAEAIFDDRRLDLVDYLKDHEPASVRALAEKLDYDKGVVSRDLQKLARIGVIEYVEEGRTKAPRLKHNHVAIEPVV